MNDHQLLLAFIQAFLTDQATLLSNSNFRVQSAFGTLQLVNSKEGIIASTKLGEIPQKLLVKRRCNYWEALREILRQHSFFPGIETLQELLVPFAQVPLLEGFEFYDSIASDIWRSWRREAVQDVQLLVAGEWQLVKEITCSGGAVFVTFRELSLEVQVTGNTQVSWLGRSVS